MELFCRKRRDVQSFMLHLANNHCEEIQSPLYPNERVDRRMRLTQAVLIIPMEKGRPAISRTFAVVTQEICSEGVTLVLSEPRGLDKMLIGFRTEGGTAFLLGEAKHLSPLGAGFYRMGVHLQRVVSAGEYPGLSSLRF